VLGSACVTSPTLADVTDTLSSPTTAEERAGSPIAPDDRAYVNRLLVVVMLAVMGFGSLMTIVTVSLSAIAEDLNTSRTTLGWIVTGLMLAMAVSTPLTGKLGDIKGHRRVFLWGLGAGIVATALCGLAWNAASLIAFRVLFGVTGAMVMPNGMALMMHAFGPSRRAAAMGWFQFAMTGAPTIGLIIGGPLIDVVGWRAIFFAFAVVSMVALVVGIAVLRDTPRQPDRPLDYLGAATLGIGVLCLLLAVTRGAGLLRTGGLGGLLGDVATMVLALGCILGLGSFVMVEQRTTYPMLKLHYFRRRNFTAPLLASALSQFAYMGGFVVVPILLYETYGWTVAGVALIMAPRPGAFSLVSPLGGHLASRLGERIPLAIGAAIMIASMLCFAGASGGYSMFGLALIVAGLTLSGTAAGLASPSSTSLVVGAVDPEDMGIANGMSQQVLFIGIVSGIQLMLVVLGEEAGSAEFVRTFLFGAAVATAGLGAALMVRAPRPSAASAH